MGDDRGRTAGRGPQVAPCERYIVFLSSMRTGRKTGTMKTMQTDRNTDLNPILR